MSLAEQRGRLGRARLLAAQVEVALADGDVTTATASCTELDELVGGAGSDLLDATSATARGALRLADGDVDRAFTALRSACSRWNGQF